MTRLSRRAIALMAGVVGIALVVTVIATVVLASRSGEVAVIDGHPVTRDELLFHMRRLTPIVQNELQNERGLQGPIDWDAPVGGTTALERLAARALDEIRRDKTMLIVADENGLSVPIEYDDLLVELDKENERRAEAAAKGETVYGVVEFSLEEYYSHRLTQIATALKRRLSADPGDPLWVSEAEVRWAFDANRDAWSANATTYRYSKLVIEVPSSASSSYVAGLQRRVDATGRLADVAATEPDAVLTTDTYDGGSVGQSPRDQELRAVLSTLEPGEISDPVVGSGHVTFYELHAKTVDEDEAFAEYSYRIRQSLIDRKFRKYLQRRMGELEVQVDTAAVGAIDAEDVQQ